MAVEIVHINGVKMQIENGCSTQERAEPLYRYAMRISKPANAYEAIERIIKGEPPAILLLVLSNHFEAHEWYAPVLGAARAMKASRMDDAAERLSFFAHEVHLVAADQERRHAEFRSKQEAPCKDY